MKKIIIVTGGIGSGKSVVCAEFAKLGARVIEADKVGHDCLRVGGAAYSEVVAAFGAGILSADGAINRGKLAEIAFSSGENLARLNAATHKHILKEIVDRVDKIGECDIIVVEIPLFWAVDFRYDAAVAVVVDDEARISRVMKRSGLSIEMINSIIASQPTNEEYRGFADYCIENNGDISSLREKARQIYSEIKGGNI
ncbi:MAG: dephospho-CoA kinase [Oscillospiraceae bacterium]|nr:dephospho-CoA kinase [Oscillospiraceae bacterium]